MKFLMVVPRYSSRPFDHYAFPLGLAYISSTLKELGHQVNVLNLNEYYADAMTDSGRYLRMLLEREFRKQDYDVVCTGSISPFFDAVKMIINTAKMLSPRIRTIVGGGLISSEPEVALRASGADFGVIGEGEEAIAELVSEMAGSRRFADIKGLVWRNEDNQIELNPERKSLKNLDSIPFPDYEGFRLERYVACQMPDDHQSWYPYDHPKLVPILTSRSCPFQCSFCYHPAGSVYRQRSLDNVFTEIDLLVNNYDVNMLGVYDEVLGTDKKRVEEFCARVKPYDLKWFAQLRVDKVDREMLDCMKDSGCCLLSYGLESASDRVLKSMRKHITRVQIENALELTSEAGIQIQGNFIFGDKAETWETFEETIGWWKQNLRHKINLSRIVPFQGSPLYEYGIHRGLIDRNCLDKYLEGGCGRLYEVNLTGMSDAEWKTVSDLVDIYSSEYGRVPCRVFSSHRDGFHAKRGPHFTLEVECPQCRQRTTLSSMHYAFPFNAHKSMRIGVGCRKCYQRFDLVPYEYEERLLSFVQQGAESFAMLGGGERGRLLLNTSINFNERIRAIIDDHRGGMVSEANGIEVAPLESLSGLAGKVDAVIVFRRYHDPWINQTLRQLEESGVKICRFEDVFEDILTTPVSDLGMIGDSEEIITRVRETFDRGAWALSEKRLDEACFIFLGLTHHFPELVQAHLALAEAALAMGDLSLATDAAMTADNHVPNDPQILALMAKIQVMTQEPDLRRPLCLRIVESNAVSPNDTTDAFFNLIATAVQNNNMVEATRYFSKYRNRLPKNEQIDEDIRKIAELLKSAGEAEADFSGY